MFDEIGLPSIFISLLVGYACGVFLTAEAVARKLAGKSAFDIGTGNPGMANIGHELGTGAAAVVLAGDVGKLVLACAISAVLAGSWSAPVAAWAGVGATIGHMFPAWHRFHGGKGVACSCAAIWFAWPLGGTAALLVGFGALLATGYLGVAAVSIVAAYCVLVGLLGPNGVLVPALVLLALSLIGSGPSCLRAARGEQAKASLWNSLHGK